MNELESRINNDFPKKRFQKVFKNPKILLEMLTKYQSGHYSSLKLGREYGVDHTTVLWQAKRYGVVPLVIKDIVIKEKPKHKFYTLPEDVLKTEPEPELEPEITLPEQKKTHKYDYIFDELQQGTKSYSEYMSIQKERDKPMLARQKKRMALLRKEKIERERKIRRGEIEVERMKDKYDLY